MPAHPVPRQPTISTSFADDGGRRPATNVPPSKATEPHSIAYEEALAKSVGAAHAIAFAFARHGLIAILEAAQMRPGDEVVLSPLTCKVVPLALLSLNLKPRYVDISPDTLNLDPEGVQSAIGPNTRAILFQHTYGNLAGIEAVAAIAARNGTLLIEDCAQCLPRAVDGYRPGSFGQAAIFSNNLLKPLPAGSGGVAVTGDSELAQKIRTRRDRMSRSSRFADVRLRAEQWTHKHLLRPDWYWPLFDLYRTISPTYKVRPVAAEIADEITNCARRVSDYQSREGMRWLRDLEAHAEHRRLGCIEYASALGSAGHLKLLRIDMAQPLYYFPVLAGNKLELLRQAKVRGLELIAWPVSTPIYPIERMQDLLAYGYEPGTCPVAEDVAQRLLGLPARPGVPVDHRRRIVALLTGLSH